MSANLVSLSKEPLCARDSLLLYSSERGIPTLRSSKMIIRRNALSEYVPVLKTQSPEDDCIAYSVFNMLVWESRCLGCVVLVFFCNGERDDQGGTCSVVAGGEWMG